VALQGFQGAAAGDPLRCCACWREVDALKRCLHCAQVSHTLWDRGVEEGSCICSSSGIHAAGMESAPEP
jgi:hypothetical protein